jgi:MFS family permease
MTGAGFAALSAGTLNVADDLVAVLALDAGPAQVGLLNAFSSAAFVFFAVPIGWWLDVVDRRRTLMVTQAVATLALLSVPVAWLCGVLTFGQLLVTSTLVGISSMVWGLGISTLLPSVVGKDKAGGAFSRVQGIETSAGLVAPGLTGVLIAVLAAPMALFFAAFFELMAGVSLWFGGRRRVPDHGGTAASEGGEEPPSAPRPKFWKGVGEGFRFAVGQRTIMLLTGSSTAMNASLALTSAVETVYFVKVLDYEPTLIGVIGMAIAGSALLGSLAGGWLLDRFRGLSVSSVGMVIASISMVLLPVASFREGLGWSLPWVLVHILAWNFCVVMSNAGQYGIVAAMTPDHLMGRVQSVRRLFSRGAVPVGGIVGGLLGESLGVVPVLWIGAVTAGIAALLTVLVRWLLREH